MNADQQALISFSGNYIVLFAVFAVVIFAFIWRYRMTQSKGVLAEKLRTQDAWLNTVRLIRMIMALVAAVVIFIALIFGFINYPNLLTGQNPPLFYLGITMIVFFLVVAIFNWVGYKAMK